MTKETRPTHWIEIEIAVDLATPQGRQRLKHAFNLLDVVPAANVELHEYEWGNWDAEEELEGATVWPFVEPEAPVPFTQGDMILDPEVDPDFADLPSAEPDWDALVQRILNGETTKDVALEAGVNPRSLNIRWIAARKRQPKAPEPPLVLDEKAFLGETAPWVMEEAAALRADIAEQGYFERIAANSGVAVADVPFDLSVKLREPPQEAPPIPLVGEAAIAEAAREEAEAPLDTIEHRPWTDANDEQLLVMARNGNPFDEIVSVLDRSPDDVEDRLDAFATTLGAALAKVRARNALINAQAVTAPPPPFWTPERDLQLAQGIIGSGLTKTIAAMGITKEEACARWNDLLPRKGIAEQTKLVAKLPEGRPDMATVKTRADDERTLMVLHLLEHGEGLSASVVGQRVGTSRSAVLGLKNRVMADLAVSEKDRTYGPPASRPENQDGAMGPLWWFRGRAAA